MSKIRIFTDKVQMEAELNETKTANFIYKSLPIEAVVNTWGEEIYFKIPVNAKLENGIDVVEEGDLGYWPQGNAFCIFFGKTPSSTDTQIRPASKVTPIGKLLENSKDWKKVKNGEKISIIKV